MAGSNLTPYWEHKSKEGKTSTFYNVDCIEGLNKHLEKDSIDVVVTSPPYNIGINYTRHNDNLPREKYLELMDEFAESVNRVLKVDGSVFLNVGNTLRDPWAAWDVAQLFRKRLKLQNVIHWVKSISITKEYAGSEHKFSEDFSVGHFKPIVSRRFLNDSHEYIFHFTKEGKVDLDKLAVGVPYQDKSNISRWKSSGSDLRDRGNIWFLPYDTINSRRERPHPATFPVKLPEMCIRLHGVTKKPIVMDPFMGIGSTALAARNLGMQFVGFDIDRNYLDEAIERMSVVEPGNTGKNSVS